MLLSIRTSTCAFVYSPVFRRASRRAAGGKRAAVLRVVTGFAALVVLLLFAIPAQADEMEPEYEPEPQAEYDSEPQAEPEPEPVPDVVSEEEAFSEPAWIPSIDFGFEAYSYGAETTIANVSGTSVPRTDTQPESLGQILFRIGGELMGPMFEDLPGRPRLFVQGGVGIPTFTNARAFELGDPNSKKEPKGGFARYEDHGAGTNDYPSDFGGQGSWLDAELQDLSWYAGLGIAFSLPTSGDLLFSIKPSVQYSREEIDFTGRMKTVVETSPPGTVDPDPCGTGPPRTQVWPLCLRTFEKRESNAGSSTTDHSIGPGIEVAMAFLSSRPIRFSLFGQVRVLWLISEETNSFADPNGLARYSVARDDFVVRGGAGVRLSWVGFD
jgi:hypothetical protein